MGPPRWLRLLALVLLAILLVDAFVLAPAKHPDWVERVIAWATGDWAGHEPYVVAQFQLMGVWPLVLASMLAPWLRGRPLPLWPFSLGSFALGGFILLPGVALPRSEVRSVGWLQSRLVAVAAGIPAMALVVWALSAGSPAGWLATAREMQFDYFHSHFRFRRSLSFRSG